MSLTHIHTSLHVSPHFSNLNNKTCLLHSARAAPVDVLALFPDLFGCIYKFAELQGWNSETPLKEMFQRETRVDRAEEPLSVPVQESQQDSVKDS